MTDADREALEAAGFVLIYEHTPDKPNPSGGTLPGDLIVRKRPPAPVESECEQRFKDAVVSLGLGPTLFQENMDKFRAALSREVEAAYTKGYTDCDKRMMKKWRDSYPPMPMEDGS